MSKIRVIEFTEEDLQGYLTEKENVFTLAKKYRANSRTITRCLLALGRKDITEKFNSNRRKGKSKLTQRQINSMVEEAEGGAATKDMAIKYGVTVALVQYYVRLHRDDEAQSEFFTKRTPRKHIILQKNMPWLVPKNEFTRAHKLMTNVNKH